MKSLKIIWTVLVNLFVVLVAMSLYGYVRSNFEQVTISLLILIYITVMSFYTQWSRHQYITMVGMAEEFRKLRALIKPDYETGEVEKEELQELKTKWDESQPKYWINVTGLFILWLLSIYHLLVI